jgi:leucyl-tRNA synthetase
LEIHYTMDLQSAFEDWYPVDLRSPDKDVVANHILFFYHHAAIFPQELLPKAIAVNGFVSLEGQKMSKSKGHMLISAAGSCIVTLK